MNRPKPLADYVWQSTDFPVCAINIPVAKISEQLNIPLTRWEEPGLGYASGFGCKLASGMAMLLEEYENSPIIRKENGPTISVEASVLIERGIEITLHDILIGLELPTKCVTWTQTKDGLESARLITLAATEHFKSLKK